MPDERLLAVSPKPLAISPEPTATSQQLTANSLKPPLDRRKNHHLAFAIDLRNAVDDQLAGIPHAGNLYRLLPADYAEQLEKALKEKQADEQS